MRIPKGPADSEAAEFPTLRTSHIRTYGAGGFVMSDMEEVHGCPAQYKARYVDWKVTAEKTAHELTYGRAIHDALFLMEEEPIGPDAALERVWPAELPLAFWREAVDDLERYLERGGPMNRFATLAVEVELYAELYEDEDFGPVWFGGRLDWLGVDLDVKQVMHLVDYKTNRWPPKVEDVKGDVQLLGYDWLVRQNWRKLGLVGRPQVVVHLDAIKYRDVEWRFSEQQLAEWRAWATAVSRQILRDEKGPEILGPGCHWCPIKLDCKSYQRLPGEGLVVAERRLTTPVEDLWRWREKAAATVKTLKAGMDEVDDMLKQKLEAEGEVVLPGERWTQEVAWSNVLDKEHLVELIGVEEYLRLSGLSKKALDEYVRNLDDEELRQAIQECWSREATGVKTKKQKDEEG